MSYLAAVLAADVDPAPITAWLTLVGAVFVIVGGVVGGVAAIWKWVAHPRIATQIAEATRPIQPGANGGVSLPDVARSADLLVERQTDVIRDVRAIRERLDDHIDNHHLKG